MESLKNFLQEYVVHKYHSQEKSSKVIEAAVYSIDKEDIKFRVIKFVNGALKEIFTSEKREEAFEKFEQYFK